MMQKKKILSFLLSLSVMAGCVPPILVSAAENPRERTAYIHAQGTNPQATESVSTVYTDQTTDVYLAVDNPNMGRYLKPQDDDKAENQIIRDVTEAETRAAETEADQKGLDGDERTEYIQNRVAKAVAAARHVDPQYDLNGYTVTIYFDPYYFDYASEDFYAPMDYTVPDKNLPTAGNGSESTENGSVNVPIDVGYYPYLHKRGTEEINGKTYKFAQLTVFFNGGYLPQKKEGTGWYNLCRLPLKALHTGSTQVFFDTSGEEHKSLELFAKNVSDDINEQTFDYTAENGGYHTIVIKDKLRPSPPTASPNEGSYTEAQTITLTAEDDCDIYYSTDGESDQLYLSPIAAEVTTTVTCYAQRRSDNKKSNTVSFTYRILPKAPHLFQNQDGRMCAIPNIYNENDRFTVYVSDKPDYGAIEDSNEIYYTFSAVSEELITDGTDPQTEWVKLSKQNPTLDITHKATVRLVTKNPNEISAVSEYRLGIRPTAPTASHPSDEYHQKLDVTLSTPTSGAKIYYTLDGGDPITEGVLYDGSITVAKDTTLRAVAEFDGIYSALSSYFYLFTAVEDDGVDAFYPSGVYEGSVHVTLTARKAEHGIRYSTDGGETWLDYTHTLLIDADTTVLAKAGRGDQWGSVYTFTYKIKPLPPQFAPESTQFTNADTISIFCPESTQESTSRFDLYYTTDESDPITSPTRRHADETSDSAELRISGYTVVKAVVLKDQHTYSDVITHSYDLVNKKPTKPLTTLLPGYYTRKIGDTVGFVTQFMPVIGGTEIYYTLSEDGTFSPDPVPNTEGTIKYDGQPIQVKGHTIIKAISVNVFGIQSDVGIFEYIITPEAPKAAPSASLSASVLPTVPVSTVAGSTVRYTLNGFENEFTPEAETFYLDTQTGNAYADSSCTQSLGTKSTMTLASPAVLYIKAELDGIESPQNRYVYQLTPDTAYLAPPYADKDTGEYEEAAIDEDNHLLHIRLSSFNTGDTIWYRLGNTAAWTAYDGTPIKIKSDTILQLRSQIGSTYSTVTSYVYHFVPLSPIITLPSGRYVLSQTPETQITYDPRAPQDKIDRDYRIWYRENGDPEDARYYLGFKRSIDHTMSFKAYVKNNTTGRVSKNTIHYYVIESENSAKGSVYIANPYDVSRISAAVLDQGEYAKGIKLLTQNKNAEIHYFYAYTFKDSTDSITTNSYVYHNIPITVNPSMTSITITAWLEENGERIDNSDFTHTIAFVHLGIPKTSLGSEKVVFPQNTPYTLLHDDPSDPSLLLYYTVDGSDPTDETNQGRKRYSGETLTLTGPITVKTVYMSACKTCGSCKNNDEASCQNRIYGRIGEYTYTTPTTITSGGGGGGGGSSLNDKRKRYTKDIFGTEHPTHISYIQGYPNGSVQPEGNITREEIAAILYRITNHAYEKPYTTKGNVFSDVTYDRWSAHDIEYMADQKVIIGYPNGTFAPERPLSRAEFAALICRFAKLNDTIEQNPFHDVSQTHWSYAYILKLVRSELVQGYEDQTFRPENNITRAEAMTVINKLLGRNPSDAYVKSLDFNPYTDLMKDTWYYTNVLEATVTHDYDLETHGLEIKWENCK